MQKAAPCSDSWTPGLAQTSGLLLQPRCAWIAVLAVEVQESEHGQESRSPSKVLLFAFLFFSFFGVVGIFSLAGYGLMGFQCIPMGNGPLTYGLFDLWPPFQYGLIL